MILVQVIQQNLKSHASVTELVYVLASEARFWGFDFHYGHQRHTQLPLRMIRFRALFGSNPKNCVLLSCPSTLSGIAAILRRSCFCGFDSHLGHQYNANMAELVDALVLGTSALKRGGSTPSIRTIIFTMSVYANWHSD